MTEKRNLELNRYLKSVESTIINKMNEGVDLLYDLRGLLKLDKGDAKKWEGYVTALSSEHKWLNTYSVAYVEKIRREDISKFEKTMRDIGDSRYKNYTVFPTIESVTAYPIRYLHTNDAEVSYLLGFDFLQKGYCR